DAAQRPDEGERPDPGRTRPAALVALVPAALQSDQEANGKGKSETLDELSRVHAVAIGLPRGLLAASPARFKRRAPRAMPPSWREVTASPAGSARSKSGRHPARPPAPASAGPRPPQRRRRQWPPPTIRRRYRRANRWR